MNINEWIKSGIIEAYVLGDLNEEEVREVEDMTQRYPEVQKEIEQTEATLEELAMKVAIKPRAGIKEQLFQQIEKESEKESIPLKPDPASKAQVSTVESPERKIRVWQYFSAAASIFLVLTTVLAVYYRQQWQSTASELENYLTENQNLTQEYQALRSDYEQLQEQQDIFADPGLTQVKLKGTEVYRSAYAVVYWNPESEVVYLNPSGLPAPESGKQYQLWAIVDGKPQNAGIFDQQGNLINMQEISNASAFAITLEPEGGSENPTLEAMYVLGEV
ncbi:anti-sigma factor [Catalinimonas niigatensis]|uniref:anti-sigma factor n=1 Tax=Catalinimonas niigatensis TaxID=1397264 RepID=UPI00266705A7|nr:anti-sigma factor [Catalinimonas niigatensis]WPP52381.1 anti-sigma factor [Catalinimonas niigatensis]